MATQIDKCRRFAQLHKVNSAWVIPNPWDTGTAKLLEGMGFPALATTSGGFAFTLGRADGEVTLEEKLRHCAQLANGTSIPITVDFENGFAPRIGDLASTIPAVIDTGIAGFSIEDYDRDNRVLYEFSEAVERIQAASEAAAGSNVPVLLTARAENLLRGVDDIDNTIKRLQAYSAAGAQVLYAPGIRSLEQLHSVTRELDKPFNCLVSFIRGATLEELSDAGATRVSIGGALCYSAINSVLTGGGEMLNDGSFNWLGTMANGRVVEKLLGGSCST